MRSRPLAELERLELIERKPFDRRRAAQWLEQSRVDVELAVSLLKDDRYRHRSMSIAYEAGFRICAGIVGSVGFRIRSMPGHHRATIEAANTALGDELGPALDRLDRARRFRNDALYGEIPTPGRADIEAVIDAVEQLAEALERKLA
jgi:hypothetical protein